MRGLIREYPIDIGQGLREILSVWHEVININLIRVDNLNMITSVGVGLLKRKIGGTSKRRQSLIRFLERQFSYESLKKI